MTGTIEANVVIVGSGVAGAMTAYKLAKLGVRDIVMLEAGPRVKRAAIVRNFVQSSFPDNLTGYPSPDHAPRPSWNGSGDPYFDFTGPVKFEQEYLRVVGGTTWHWGGCTPRFRPADLKLASSYGIGVDWPLDYEALEPFYCEAESEIGVAGDAEDGSPRSKSYPMPRIASSYCDKVIEEGLKPLGINFDARPVARASRPYDGRSQCQGFGTCSPICPSGALWAAVHHVEKAERLGVRLLDQTRVDRIHADRDVTHVEASRADGSSLKVTGKIFVLAANGMETPRLLLMSATESLPHGLANSSGLVGRHFMEHPSLSCRLKMPKPVYSGRGPVNIVASSAFRDGSFRETRPSSILSIEHGQHYHEDANSLLTKGLEPPQIDAEMKALSTRTAELRISLEQLPDKQNGITLNWEKRDRAGQPVIKLYHAFGAYEEAGFSFARDTFKKIASVLKADILSVSGPGPQFHMMGMTRMGTDPRKSVTDSFGRSHDHRNLFVLGSSLFPTAGAANPTLTIAALCLRAANEIAQQLKRP